MSIGVFRIKRRTYRTKGDGVYYYPSRRRPLEEGMEAFGEYRTAAFRRHDLPGRDLGKRSWKRFDGMIKYHLLDACLFSFSFRRNGYIVIPDELGFPV